MPRLRVGSIARNLGSDRENQVTQLNPVLGVEPSGRTTPRAAVNPAGTTKIKTEDLVPKTLEVGVARTDVGVFQDNIATRVGTHNRARTRDFQKPRRSLTSCFTVRGIGDEPKHRREFAIPQTERSTRRSWVEFSLQPGYLPTFDQNKGF